jgi:hypothetical protein
MPELRPKGHVPANRFGLYAPMIGPSCPAFRTVQETEEWPLMVQKLHWMGHHFS